MAESNQGGFVTVPGDGAPILLRREENVGHGGRSVSRTIGLAADVLGFFNGAIGTNAS